MTERIILLLIIFGASFAADGSRIMRASRRERIVVWCLMALALYLGADFVLKAKLPHLDELLDFLFSGAVRIIIDYFQAGLSAEV